MSENPACYFINFGLIVTGKSEQYHLPKLFKSLMAFGICSFQIIRFTSQLSPVTSKRRILKMVGTQKKIPDKADEQIGLPAKRYIEKDLCNFVLLIDDLEYSRRNQARQVFERYRNALDNVLNKKKNRASVHFLVNMLEAYYFADANAINTVLHPDTPFDDYPSDVENIRNPKAKLKKLFPGFSEIDDGGKILKAIDMEHVLSRPDTCPYLRTMFAWCLKVMEPVIDHMNLEIKDKYRITDGILSDITEEQIDLSCQAKY